MELALRAVARCLGLRAPELHARSIGRGVTHETFLIDAGAGPLAVLRFAPPDPHLLPGLHPGVEGELLEVVASSVPVPEVLLADADGSLLGRSGLVLRYVPGANPQSWQQLRSAGGEAAAEDALQVLIRLHLSGAGRRWQAHQLEITATELAGSLEREVAGLGAKAPAALGEALHALVQASPAASGPACLVHGDFRPANLVVGQGVISAVLDWEMAALGDPTRDLGIATMAAWGRWWPDADLIRRYREGGGPDLDPVSLLWWRCLGYALVIRFLTRRDLAGWGGSPALGSFVSGLAAARAEWESARA